MREEVGYRNANVSKKVEMWHRYVQSHIITFSQLDKSIRFFSEECRHICAGKCVKKGNISFGQLVPGKLSNN